MNSKLRICNMEQEDDESYILHSLSVGDTITIVESYGAQNLVIEGFDNHMKEIICIEIGPKRNGKRSKVIRKVSYERFVKFGTILTKGK